jgi:carbonic anhydrase
MHVPRHTAALLAAMALGGGFQAQAAAFGKLYPMNARPTQPLNGRTIEATR